MRPSTLVDLSEHYGAPPPAPPDGSFETFIRLYRAAAAVLRTPDDYVRLVHEVVEDAAADGVVWLEPAEWLAPGQPERVGLADAQAVLDLLLLAAGQASARTGVAVGLMVSTNRTRPPEDAVALARLAERYAGRGVVSFGLADDETKGRPEPFAAAFDIARAAGLIASPHAGEHGGPDSVRGALDALGARRIQHGVRSTEDPELLRRLADSDVCLDVCPTSNVQLRVVESLAAHPLPALLDAGVNVSFAPEQSPRGYRGLAHELTSTPHGTPPGNSASQCHIPMGPLWGKCSRAFAPEERAAQIDRQDFVEQLGRRFQAGSVAVEPPSAARQLPRRAPHPKPGCSPPPPRRAARSTPQLRPTRLPWQTPARSPAHCPTPPPSRSPPAPQVVPRPNLPSDDEESSGCPSRQS